MQQYTCCKDSWSCACVQPGTSGLLRAHSLLPAHVRMLTLQDLSPVLRCCRNVTDEALAELARIPSLAHITLKGSLATNDGLQLLRALPRLTHLDLGSRWELDDTGAAAGGGWGGVRLLRVNFWLWSVGNKPGGVCQGVASHANSCVPPGAPEVVCRLTCSPTCCCHGCWLRRRPCCRCLLP